MDNNEAFNPSYEQNQDAREDDLGMQELSQMEPFEEHMQSFSEAKQSGEVPEGVRDEQDYKEFLAEQEAKNKEYDKLDKEIFEGIASIEDPADRNLAIAILPCYYNQDLDSGSSRRTRDLANREAMKAVVDYMNSDKTTSLGNSVYNTINKKYGEAEIGSEEAVAGYIAMEPLNRKLPSLSIGNKVEQFNITESVADPHFNTYNFVVEGPNQSSHEFRFGKDMEYDTIDEESKESAKVALVLANDLAEKLHSSNDYKGRDRDLSELYLLQNTYHTAWHYMGDALSNKVREATNAIAEDIDNIMDSEDYDRDNSSLSFRENSVPYFANARRTVSDYNRYMNANKEYKESLDLGQKILSGKEDWHRIDWREIGM